MWISSCGALSGLAGSLALLSSIPVTMADGTQDMRDLSTIITNASNIIWAPLNDTNYTTTGPNGAGLFAILRNTISTADLLGNVTGSVLRSKFNLDIDQAGFVNQSATPMDAEYLSYIQTISTLSSALTYLGRSWHTELNAPIYLCIGALSQSIYAYGTDLLERDLLTSNATIRTIHAANTLADAQSAWSKILNYPGGDHKSGHGSSSYYRRSYASSSFTSRRDECSDKSNNVASTMTSKTNLGDVVVMAKRHGTIVGRSIVPWA